jgi:hypothetical protein
MYRDSNARGAHTKSSTSLKVIFEPAMFFDTPQARKYSWLVRPPVTAEDADSSLDRLVCSSKRLKIVNSLIQSRP